MDLVEGNAVLERQWLTEILQSVMMAGTMLRRRIRMELSRMCGRWPIRSGRRGWRNREADSGCSFNSLDRQAQRVLRMRKPTWDSGFLPSWGCGEHFSLGSGRWRF